MTSSMLRGVRRSFALLAAGTTLAAGGAAVAQTRVPAGAVVQPLPGSDEGAELRRHLADLAANPRSVASLIGAGRAAIRVGDGQAALGFFARGEEIAPNDARVKAGMASAFVLLGQSAAALRFFAEAARLGAPEAEIARDRGLAFDMAGNPRRAQQDYALVLQRGEDAETRRRMALSLAISGHRDAALRAIDPLLRRRDPAAFRTRAFILALTGDPNGAAQAVDAAMPGQGAAMSPFLSRLAGLSPTQKAMAVHFGHFPADGRPVQMAQAVDTSAHPAAVALTGAAPMAHPTRPSTQPAPAPARRRTALAEPVNRDPRRRPGTEELDRSARIGPGSRGDARPVRTTVASPQRQQPVRTQTPAASQPTEIARAVVPLVRTPPSEVKREDSPPAAQPGFATAAPQAPVVAATDQRLEIPPAMRQDPPVSAPRQDPAPAPRQDPPVVPLVREPAPTVSEPAPAATPPAQPAFEDVAALVQSLPAEEEARPAPAPARAPARDATTRTAPRQAAPRAAATPARTAARPPAAPAHPSRHWVQLANGERANFAFQLGRLRQAAPELLRSRTAWWAQNGSSERLLVGPFATAVEARAFVTQLSRQQVSAFPWTSDAGEEVARLPAR